MNLGYKGQMRQTVDRLLTFVADMNPPNMPEFWRIQLRLGWCHPQPRAAYFGLRCYRLTGADAAEFRP